MEYNKIEFDDFEIEYKNWWSQICDNCLEKHPQLNAYDEHPLDEIICGVKGCKNKAHYYIDFKYETKKLDKGRINFGL